MGIFLAFIYFNCSLFAQALTVEVKNLNSQPEPYAQVLVGYKPHSPFENNFTFTNTQGLAVFNNATQIENLPITIVSPGRPHITYLKQSGSFISLTIPSPRPQDLSELKGQFKNWSNPGQNNFADFGAVIPLVSPTKIFELQVSDFMSTKMDELSVVGQKFYLPSNISIPKQKLKYSFFSINLEKPNYLLPVASPQQYHFTAITGRFPFEKTANTLMSNDKTFLDIINDIKYEKEFIVYNQNITQATHHYDFDVNFGHKLTPCVSALAQNYPENFKVLTLALVQDFSQAGTPLTVTDLKLNTDKYLKLSCLEKDKKDITLAAVGFSYKNTDKKIEFGKGFTIALKKSLPRDLTSTFAKDVTFSSFFEIPKLTVLNKGNTLVFSRVEKKQTPQAIGYYAQLSEVLEKRTPAPDGDLIEYNIPKWIVIGTEPPHGLNTESFDLPQLPKNFFQQSFTPTRKKRWELTWVGSENMEQTPQNIDFNYVEVATHASRNSQDF